MQKHIIKQLRASTCKKRVMPYANKEEQYSWALQLSIFCPQTANMNYKSFEIIPLVIHSIGTT